MRKLQSQGLHHVTIEDGKISGFRVRLGVSFKYEKE